MNFKLFPVVLATSMMLGCAVGARMYPVQGPLASQTPEAVYSGKVTGVLNSGSITIVVADGEVCKGRWTRVVAGRSPAKPPAGAQAADASLTEGMPVAWDTVYGQGFYVANVLGATLYARGSAAGNKGTVLNVEFYRLNPGSEAPPRIDGVAKDNHGNIFKLTL